MNEELITNKQFKKVLNTLPIKEFIIFLKKNKSILYGKTALEFKNKMNITLPYYIYNINLLKNDIYLYILKIAKKNRILYSKNTSPYGVIYFLKEIPIFYLVNIKFNIPNTLENISNISNLHIIDIYFKYIHNYDYKYPTFIKDLKDYNIIDKSLNIELLNYDINTNNSYDKYLTYFNKLNYINTGVNAFNIHMNKKVSGILTILLINENKEIEKNKNKLIFQKETCNIYYFKYYYNVYDIKDPDTIIMKIFILKKPINIIKKYNTTTPHGTLFFLAINYFLTNDIYYYYLFNDLLYKLHNTPNILSTSRLQCFTNDNLKNYYKYYYDKLFNPVK